MLSRRLRLSGDFDFRVVAKRTPGFVGADLAALMKESAALAVKRIFQQLEVAAEAEEAARAADSAAAEAAGLAEGAAAAQQPPVTPGPAPEQLEAAQQDVQQPAAGGEQQATAAGGGAAQQRRLGAGALSSAELAGLAITMADFEEAVPKVQPSVRREGFATTPDVTWDDVGSLGEVGLSAPVWSEPGTCVRDDGLVVVACSQASVQLAFAVTKGLPGATRSACTQPALDPSSTYTPLGSPTRPVPHASISPTCLPAPGAGA